MGSPRPEIPLLCDHLDAFVGDTRLLGVFQCQSVRYDLPRKVVR